MFFYRLLQMFIFKAFDQIFPYLRYVFHFFSFFKFGPTYLSSLFFIWLSRLRQNLFLKFELLNFTIRYIVAKEIIVFKTTRQSSLTLIKGWKETATTFTKWYIVKICLVCTIVFSPFHFRDSDKISSLSLNFWILPDDVVGKELLIFKTEGILKWAIFPLQYCLRSSRVNVMPLSRNLKQAHTSSPSLSCGSPITWNDFILKFMNY